MEAEFLEEILPIPYAYAFNVVPVQEAAPQVEELHFERGRSSDFLNWD